MKAMRSIWLGAAAALLLSVGSGQSAIIVQTGVDNAGTGNVLSNACAGNVTSGLTVQGCLNQNQNQFVNFTGAESLTYTGGQATLDAGDGSFTSVIVSLVGGGAFNKLLLNIDSLDDGFVTFTGLPGGSSSPFALDKNGQNKFIITGEDFTSVSFLTTVGIADVKQVRIGLSPPPTQVPEPGSLAIISMGLLGLAFARRLRRVD